LPELRKIMKTLTIATVVLLALPTWAEEYPAQPPQPPPYPQQPYPQQYPQQPQQPQPYVIPPPQDQVADPYANAAQNDEWDEDGYDVEQDVYYDTVAAENYDDGYDPNAYQQFQGALSPYGEWVNDPSYGQVWVPSSSVVGADFSPYASGGHWVFTDDGWTWYSDWDWGWAPFHYGRWIDLTGYGWSWIPGSVWGPGWVSWRCGGGYAGWAPLPPRGVTVGPPRGIRSPWHFTLAHEIGASRPRYLPAAVMPTVFAKTSVITQLRGAGTARFNAGPSPTLLHAQVTAMPRQQLGPRVMPRPAIAARPGVPLQARPWVRNPPRPSAVTLHPIAPRAGSVTVGNPMPVTPRPAPLYRPTPTNSAPYTPYHPTYSTQPTPYHPTYTPPAAYRAPQPAYHPTYTAPAYHPTYTAPAYHPTYTAPAYHYSAPSYSAPSYHAAPAPSYHAAPSYSAPSYSAPSYHPAPAPSYHAAPAPSVSHFGGGGGRHR
jgi:hypothetical protein